MTLEEKVKLATLPVTVRRMFLTGGRCPQRTARNLAELAAGLLPNPKERSRPGQDGSPGPGGPRPAGSSRELCEQLYLQLLPLVREGDVRGAACLLQQLLGQEPHGGDTGGR